MRTTTFRTGLAAALLLLAGCGGGGGEDSAEPETSTAANGDEITRGDVEFASGMLQHHAEALAVVDLTLGKSLDPGLQALVEDVRSAHISEVEQLTTLLTDWGEEVPETVRDHANSHEREGDHAELEAADGAAFAELWVPEMLAALEDCAELAEDHEAQHAETVALAEAIEESHRDDIETLEELR